MKIKYLLFSFVFIFCANVTAQEYLRMIDEGTYSVQQIIDNAEAYFEGKDKGRGSGYKQFKRWEYMAKRLMNEDGYLPTLTENLNELQRFNAYLNETADSRLSLNDNWQEIGPTIYNATSSWSAGIGRITGFAVDKTDTDHIIVGANTGGIWKTTDGGQNWTVLTDNLANIDVYSVAIDPFDSDVYFFGSRSGLIFKSTDSGATWNELGDVGSSTVNKILIDPANSNRMFVTSSNDGVFRTLDGGITWINAIPTEGSGYDVEFKPGDTNTVFASGLETYRSTDGGLTFTQLNIPASDTAAEMIGMSIDDPETVYVIRGNGNFRGLYKSTNGGDSFVLLSHSGRNYFNASIDGTGTGGQAPRDMDIVVNPNNVDEVHIAGVNAWRSTNGGTSFQISGHWFLPEQSANNIGYCHADVDYMEFVDGVLYLGTDGGFFKATDPSAPISTSYFEDLSDGLGITQFYLIDAAQSSTNPIVAGGTQDNGSFVYRENSNDIVNYMGADGGGTIVRRTNPNLIFGTTQFGNVYRSTNAGESSFFVGGPSGNGPFVTQMEEDSSDNSIYIGYNRIYKSTNNGASWSIISQPFSDNVTDFEIAGSNNQVIYAAAGNRVYKTTDGGSSTWTFTTPGGNINAIAVHPSDPNRVAVAVASGQKVYVTTDGGANWEGYRKNLPNFSALSITWDDNGKNGLYLGMNYGVYYIDGNLTEWETYSNNLPNVRVNDLVINNENNTLYAGTYGRGLWSTPLVADGTLNTESFTDNSYFNVSPNPADSYLSINFERPLDVDIRIFDVTGKLMIFEENISVERSHNINITALTPGVYFVRVNSSEGISTKKVIKR